MQTIAAMFSHMEWANHRLLAALKAANTDEACKAATLFLHLLEAERIWLNRLQGRSSSGIELWPNRADLEACSVLIKENSEGYRDWLSGMTEELLHQPILYRNQSGQPFETSARDIVTHVALHGQYHRGQINALLRMDGASPAVVDYILYSRLGGGASASE